MTPEVAIKWAEALESGEYRQTVRTLRNAHDFCCLGVLHDITPGAEWEGFSAKGFIDSGELLPEITVQFSGLSHREQENFVLVNDYQKLSFKEIATYIRKEYT